MSANPLRVNLIIAADGRSATGEIDNVNRSLANLDRNGRQAQNALSGMGNSLAGTVVGFVSLGAAIAGMRELVTVAARTESLNNALKAITGTSQQAAQEMEYLQRTASKLGVSFVSLSESYSGIAAAGKAAGMSTADVHKIFESVSRAMAVLGKSSEDTKGALLAVSQMMSKGKISAEDYTQQLGERLPGAVALMAKALNVGKEQLFEMMGKGQITSDALLKLADVLDKDLKGSVNGLNNELARLGNAWDELKRNLGNAEFFKSTVKTLTEGLRLINQELKGAEAVAKERFSNLLDGLGDDRKMDKLKSMLSVVDQGIASIQQKYAGNKSLLMPWADADSMMPAFAKDKIKQLEDERNAILALMKTTTELGAIQKQQSETAVKSGNAQRESLIKQLQAEEQRIGMYPGLLQALAQVESGTRQVDDATGKLITSAKGAVGVLQLMQDSFDGKNIKDVNVNIREGAAYLQQLINKYKDLDTALKAYNWGPGNMDSWLKTGKGVNGQDMPRETIEYARKVQEAWKKASEDGYKAMQDFSKVAQEAERIQKKASDDAIKGLKDQYQAHESLNQIREGGIQAWAEAAENGYKTDLDALEGYYKQQKDLLDDQVKSIVDANQFDLASFQEASDKKYQLVVDFATARSRLEQEYIALQKTATETQLAMLDQQISKAKELQQPQEEINKLLAEQIKLKSQVDGYGGALAQSAQKLSETVTAGIRENAKDAQDAISQTGKKGSDELNQNARETEQVFKNIAGNIHEGLSGVFQSLLKGGTDSFKNLFDNIKNWFIKLLADMAAAAIARPIMASIIPMMGGAMGLSGSAQGSILGELGGSGSSGFGILDALSGGKSLLSLGSGLFGGVTGIAGTAGISSSIGTTAAGLTSVSVNASGAVLSSMLGTVTAGIGLLAMAVPMIMDMFKGTPRAGATYQINADNTTKLIDNYSKHGGDKAAVADIGASVLAQKAVQTIEEKIGVELGRFFLNVKAMEDKVQIKGTIKGFPNQFFDSGWMDGKDENALKDAMNRFWRNLINKNIDQIEDPALAESVRTRKGLKGIYKDMESIDQIRLATGEITETKKALEGIRAQFSKMRETATRLKMDLDSLDKAEEKSIKGLQDQLLQQAYQLAGEQVPFAMQMDQLNESFDKLRTGLKELGKDTAIIDQLQSVAQKRLQDSAKNSADALLASMQKLANGTDEATTAFDALIAQFKEFANAASGAGISMETVQGYFEQALNASKSQYLSPITQLSSDIDALIKPAKTFSQLMQDIDMATSPEQIASAGRAAYALLTQQKQTSENLKASWKNIADLVKSLKLSDMSTLSPEGKLRQARGNYGQLLLKAQAGDADAISKLGSAAQDYLSSARNYYASSPEYARIFSDVTSTLEGLAQQGESDTEKLIDALQLTAEQKDSLANLQTKVLNAGELLWNQQREFYSTQFGSILDELRKLNEKVETSAPTPSSSAPATFPFDVSAVNTYPVNFPFNVADYNRFAAGGRAGPGLALVGEQGPELVNFRDPAMVYTTAQTQNLLGGSSDETVAELKNANTELKALVRVQATGNTEIVNRIASLEQAMTSIERRMRLAA